MQNYTRLRKLAVLAMLSALAYILMYFFRIPVVMFLKYEPKDIIILIGGFLFGPLSALAMSVVVSLVEMVTYDMPNYIYRTGGVEVETDTTHALFDKYPAAMTDLRVGVGGVVRTTHNRKFALGVDADVPRRGLRGHPRRVIGRPIPDLRGIVRRAATEQFDVVAQ